MKTAIFLGAGASSEDGAPLQSEIFSKYFSGLGGAGLSQGNGDEKALVKYFQKMFGIDVSACSSDIIYPTFEEAMGILDLAVMRDESYMGFTNHEIMSLRHYLVKLLACVIGCEMDRPQTKGTSRNTDSGQPEPSHHKQLVQNLIVNDKISEAVFMSTNYDILIDNALAFHSQEFNLNYGIEFTNTASRGPLPEKSINLFKLHGSLNWLYCPGCSTMELTPFEETAVYSFKCSACGSEFSTLIVPPTYFKSLTNAYLGMVWVKAELALREVQHIIFCGYSFPDVDMHIKYLIKRIQNYRKHDLLITVINNHDGKTDEAKENEKNRFQRFLGSSVHYTDASFGEFASDPLRYWK